MTLEKMKRLLAHKKSHLIELKYDEKYCHSESLSRQAKSQIIMVENSINILESRIKEFEK